MLRELCFNEKCLPVPLAAADALEGNLVALSEAISVLVNEKVAEPVLRMGCSLLDIVARDGLTLYESLVQGVQGAEREHFAFLMGLLYKVPYEQDVSKELRQSGAAFDSELVGLMWSMVAGFIACSVQGEELWRNSTLDFECSYLQDDGEILVRTSTVDHVSCANHAYRLVDQANAALAEATVPRDFWGRRTMLCKHLTFGLDVENQLAGIDESEFALILDRLRELDQSAREWKESATDVPKWRSHVTPESGRSRKDPKEVKARTFKDDKGDPVYFEWHARYGSGGRIHFVFARDEFKITIGYCGKHL